MNPLEPRPVGSGGPAIQIRPALAVDPENFPLPADRMLKESARRSAHLPDYFANAPQTYLVNPQHLLSEPQEEEIHRFLEYHAAESSIDVYTLVFDVGQEASGGANLDNFAATWFPNEQVVVVAYFLGNPDATDVGASPALRSRFGDDRLEKLRSTAVQDALVVSDHVDQLDRLCLRMSLHLFWLEQEERDHVQHLAALEAERRRLAEQERVRAAVARKARVRRHLASGALIGGPTLLALLVVWHTISRRRFERLESEVLYFGELSPARRLGAPYCGGTPIVISYAEEE